MHLTENYLHFVVIRAEKLTPTSEPSKGDIAKGSHDERMVTLPGRGSKKWQSVPWGQNADADSALRKCPPQPSHSLILMS